MQRRRGDGMRGGKVNTTLRNTHTHMHKHEHCVDLFDVLLYVVGAWGFGLVIGLIVAGA